MLSLETSPVEKHCFRKEWRRRPETHLFILSHLEGVDSPEGRWSRAGRLRDLVIDSDMSNNLHNGNVSGVEGDGRKKKNDVKNDAFVINSENTANAWRGM